MNMANKTWYFNSYSTPRQPRCTPEINPHTLSKLHGQLLLIFHASKCQRLEIESNANGEQYLCAYPNCASTRFVLNHMDACEKGKSCAVPHCSTTRQHLDHWNYCRKSGCPACSPFRKHSNPLQVYWTDSGVPNHAISTSNQRTNGAESTMPQQSGTFEPEQFGVAKSRYTGYTAAPIPTKTEVLISKQTLPISFGDDTRNWRLYVSYDQRNLFVYKLIHGAFHFPNPEALLDAKMEKMENHARQLENNIFQRANSRSEYVEMISQKMSELKTEFTAMNSGKRGLLPTPTTGATFH